MRPVRIAAVLAALSTYALIVLGAVVRITGSGMGCGDHWPLCNGRLIPPLDDVPTVIEWSHRLAAAAVSTLVLVLAALALLRRREPGVSGSGGALHSALLAVGLLATQVLLGAVTVWLELPAAVVTLHLGVALALLATLIVTAQRVRSGPLDAASPGIRKGTLAAVILAAVVLLLGGVTASTHAGFACLGFPLCNGQVWPSGGTSHLPLIQWLHRLAAYALVLHLAGMAAGAVRRGEPASIRRPLDAALVLALGQVGIAAVMVTHTLPTGFRAAHAAAASAIWIALIWLAGRVFPALGGSSRVPSA